jgi:hypothetical protein
MHTSSSIVDALDRAPEIVVPLVLEVPPIVLRRRPAPGKWSAHEHACHLAVVHPAVLRQAGPDACDTVAGDHALRSRSERACAAAVRRAARYRITCWLAGGFDHALCPFANACHSAVHSLFKSSSSIRYAHARPEDPPEPQQRPSTQRSRVGDGWIRLNPFVSAGTIRHCIHVD